MVKLEYLSKYIWFNGDFVKTFDAKISVLSHSLHYASSAFEGEASYQGLVFKLQEHTVRLFQSANALSIKIPFTVDDIKSATKELMEKNKIFNAYIRPLVWCGSESMQICSPDLSNNIMIALIPFNPIVKKNFTLMISEWVKASPNSIPINCKVSGGYTNLIISKRKALQLGYDDALLLDWRGYIAECTSSNIFFANKDKLITPLPDCFLNGITRKTVLMIASELGLGIEERHIKVDEIKDYSECFITGTACEIQPVKTLVIDENKNIIFNNQNVTEAIIKNYTKLIGKI